MDELSRYGLFGIVGNTPIVELRNISPNPKVRIFAKLEGQNPSGSIKDRIVLAMMEEAEKQGFLREGDTIVEASTGNTAIAVSALAPRRGYKVHVILPRGIVPSIADILALYGSEIEWVDPKAGMGGALDRAQELILKPRHYALGQFTNSTNVQCHYKTTGTEIVNQMENLDVFIAGIGTGGTIMGVGRRLRENWPDIKIIGVEPRLGEKLQGLRSLSEGFIPPLLDLSFLNGRFMVDSADAISTVKKIIASEGIFSGISCGATLHTALRVAETMQQGNILTMFSDGAWKYLPSKPWDAAEAKDAELDEVHWW
ncbi:MAG: cysteine synthase B [Chloroflexi bacterium]|nr:cysteine synthase B [Chloroflexota bacterium]|tara:strand:- start:4803 stop:5741 length:939 start_codon:yes stop_codon:yes gene_type:complete